MKRSTFVAGAAALSLAPHSIEAATVQARVAAIARDVPGIIGVYCRTLADAPPLIAYHAEAIFPTASTIKLLIMTTAFALEERHPGTLAQELVTHRRDLIGGSDFMIHARDGQRFTVAQLLVPMIQLSDNTASNMLIDHFGMDAINRMGATIGMRHTVLARTFLDFTAIVHHQDNLTAPADMGELLYRIALGAREGVRTVVSATHCRRMIEIMLGQTDRDGIPAGLPHGIQVANKTGEIDGTRNDMAIVEPFGDSPYVLAIFSKDVRDYARMYRATHRLARLSFESAGRSGA
ncbi:MAG TPA: serine hydrolase [Candidatus Dormibacteraeota bacterium]|nr:serine hydrolase [Candidatus Dormibacteraeota bacterium]